METNDYTVLENSNNVGMYSGNHTRESDASIRNLLFKISIVNSVNGSKQSNNSLVGGYVLSGGVGEFYDGRKCHLSDSLKEISRRTYDTNEAARGAAVKFAEDFHEQYLPGILHVRSDRHM